MLKSLHIENIAVIKRADIDFEGGFTVLTGETGAGKSILIDAIGLLLGARAERELIRSGEKSALVSAMLGDISRANLSRLKDECDITPDEEGNVFINRTVTIDGKSKTKINGIPVPASVLRSVMSVMLNIHGQNDSGALLNDDVHRKMLDLYGANELICGECENSYKKMSDIEKEIKSLTTDESEKSRRAEMLKYQIKDIDAMKLKPGEEEELEAKRRKIADIEKITRQSKIVYRALYRNAKGTSACELASIAQSALQSLGDALDGCEEYISKLDEIKSVMEDIAERAYGLLEPDIEDPAAYLDKIETRLDAIGKAEKKYGATIEDILEFREEAVSELDRLELSDVRIKELEKELASAKEKYKKDAEKLTQARKKAAISLENEITAQFVDLDLPKMKFRCEIKESLPSRFGTDSVEYLIAANSGEPYKPLSKTASGGELSRIMLAMKTVFAEKDDTETLIYDEIDTGISGATSQKIGKKLLMCSKSSQIICVTHSAQIAALADAHFLITKNDVDGRTETGIRELDRAGRVSEVARIMGGQKITDSVIRASEELIEQRNNI